MPRKARIDEPGALHHIIVRGIERAKVFKDDTDRGQGIRVDRGGAIADPAAGKGTKPGQGPQSFLLLGGTRAWDEHVGAFAKTGAVSFRRKSVGQAW